MDPAIHILIARLWAPVLSTGLSLSAVAFGPLWAKIACAIFILAELVGAYCTGYVDRARAPNPPMEGMR